MNNWHLAPPANTSQLKALAAAAPRELPTEYYEFMGTSNGGEGPLGIEPGWLVIWSAEETVLETENEFTANEFPNYFFFGCNGGGESIAMRWVSSEQPEIVSIDLIAGENSSLVIAPNFCKLATAFGKEHVV